MCHSKCVRRQHSGQIYLEMGMAVKKTKSREKLIPDYYFDEWQLTIRK